MSYKKDYSQLFNLGAYYKFIEKYRNQRSLNDLDPPILFFNNFFVNERFYKLFEELYFEKDINIINKKRIDYIDYAVNNEKSFITKKTALFFDKLWWENKEDLVDLHILTYWEIMNI